MSEPPERILMNCRLAIRNLRLIGGHPILRASAVAEVAGVEVFVELQQFRTGYRVTPRQILSWNGRWKGIASFEARLERQLLELVLAEVAAAKANGASQIIVPLQRPLRDAFRCHHCGQPFYPPTQMRQKIKKP
ncbi:MAG TPA: hypothetical protein VGI19_11055 [Candidatus Cybelea sp.]|jgi:hypothetical protein